MVFLILESLGSTELLFILAMALVFFGPRKLPQLSRTAGKHLADFRRASEDFKRTWDREVTMEEFNASNSVNTPLPPPENSILGDGNLSQTLQPPTIEPVAPDRVISRQQVESVDLQTSQGTDSASITELNPVDQEPEPPRKRDWL